MSSEFLRGKARASRYNVNRNYGPDAYGGSNAKQRSLDIVRDGVKRDEERRETEHIKLLKAAVSGTGESASTGTGTGASSGTSTSTRRTYTPTVQDWRVDAGLIPDPKTGRFRPSLELGAQRARERRDSELYRQALAAAGGGDSSALTPAEARQVSRARDEERQARLNAYESTRGERGRAADESDDAIRAAAAASGTGYIYSPVYGTEAEEREKARKKQRDDYRAAQSQRQGELYRGAQGQELTARERDAASRLTGAGSHAVMYALDEEYRAELDAYNRRQGLVETADEPLKHLTDGEREVIRYYAAKGDLASANDYIDTLRPELNARLQSRISEDTRRMAERDPAAGAIYNITAAKEAGAALIPTAKAAFDEAVLGRHSPVDTNSRAFRAAHAVEDTTAGVGNAAYKAAGGGRMGEAARFLAETGLSIGQFASLLPMGQTAPLAFMGSQAAGGSALDALERGGSAPEALALSVGAGVIETLTERIGIDNLFRVARSGRRGLKGFLQGTLSQMGAEGSEETVAEIANNIADAVIMGEQGEFSRLVDTIAKERGITRHEAEKEALFSLYVVNPARAFAGGALSGAAMGAGGGAANAAYTRAADAIYSRQARDVYGGLASEMERAGVTPAQVIEAARESGVEAAEAMANAIDERIAQGGEEMSREEMAKLHLLAGEFVSPEAVSQYEERTRAEEAAAETQQEGVDMLRERSRSGFDEDINVPGNVREDEQSRSDNTIVTKLRASIPQLSGMDAVVQLTGDEFKKSDVKLTKQVSAFFERLGNKITRKGLGDVILDERGAKSDIAHGIGRAKAATFAAVPYVIEKGRQIDYEENWRGRGKNSYVFAAPVGLAGRKTYVAAVVIQDEDNRFYLHEVVDEDGNILYKTEEASAPSRPGITAQGGFTGSLEASSGEASPVEAGANSDTIDSNAINLSDNTISNPAQEVNGENAAQEGETAREGSSAETEETAPAEEENRARGENAANAETREAAAQAQERIQRTLSRPAKAGYTGTPAGARALNREQRRFYDKLGRLLGVEIQIVDSIPTPDGAGANGLYKNGHVLIAADADNPFNVVLKHEITHHFERTAPKMYRQYKEAALSFLSESGRDIAAEYSEAFGLERSEAEHEAAADFTEQFLTERGAVERLISERRGVANALHGAISRVIGRIRGITGSEAGQYVRQMDNVTRLWKECLKEARENRGANVDGAGRYSRKGQSEQLKRIARLTKENIKLKEQFRRTSGVRLDESDVRRVAKQFLSDYSSEYDAEEFKKRLGNLYAAIKNYKGDEASAYTAMRECAKMLGKLAVDSALSEQYDGMEYEYRRMLELVRSRDIKISQEMRDSAHYDDLRRHNMSRLRLRREGDDMGVLYSELSEMLPGMFPDDILTPIDQMQRISDVLDSLKPIYENPYSDNLEEAYEQAASDILERIAEVREAAPTMADKNAKLKAENKRLSARVDTIKKSLKTQKEKRDAAVLANRIEDGKRYARQIRRLEERLADVTSQLESTEVTAKKQLEAERTLRKNEVKKAIEEERKRREKAVDTLKQKYRAKTEAAREKQKARELRQRIDRHTKALSQKLLRPSDNRHVPEGLRTLVARTLATINKESAYGTDYLTGKKTSALYRGQYLDTEPTKKTETFRELRKKYEAIYNGVDDDGGGSYTMVVDPDLIANLEEAESWKDASIDALTSEQLQTLWEIVRGIEASIKTANRALATSRFNTISGMAEALRRGAETDSPYREFGGGIVGGTAGRLRRLALIDMLTPQAYFHRFGAAGDEIFRMLRDAQDEHIKLIKAAQDHTERTLGDADIKTLEEDTREFEVRGGKVVLSKAQIMSLYELMKREQAKGHVLGGGIRATNTKRKGSVRDNTQNIAVKLTEEECRAIIDTLSEDEKRLADRLQKYMGGTMSEAGNRASMEVYGYKKFTEKNYFPIKADDNSTRNEESRVAPEASIAQRGFTKATVTGAKNPIIVDSIFDVYSRHINDMAVYSAYLAPLENLRRVRDFKFKTGDKENEQTMKGVISSLMGEDGVKYWKQLSRDLNGGVQATYTVFSDRLTGNYKAAAVSANLRVILQQPTAILRAAAEINPVYLMSALRKSARRGEWERIMTNSPIARWKDWGYFDINTGRQVKDVILGTDTAFERLRQAGMKGARVADSVSWALLYHAIEDELAARGGVRGTESFDAAVAARFSDIIDKTQVVDGILQRSQAMRSKDALTKMSTAFMAEPTKTYNMFLSAAWDLRRAKSETAKAGAKRKLARTSAALVLSFAVNAVMQSLVDAWRDDDRDKDFQERFIVAYFGFKGDEETGADRFKAFWDGNFQANFNPMSYFPYIKDIVSILQGYDATRMDMEAVDKIITSFQNAQKALSGEGKRTVFSAMLDLASEVSRATGLPAANIKRDAVAIVSAAARESGNYYMQYKIDRTFYSLGGNGNLRRFVSSLRAAQIAGDEEAAQAIYDDLIKSGADPEKIRKAVENAMKEEQGVTSVSELDSRALFGEDRAAYDAVASAVEASKVWQEANDAERNAYKNALYAATVGTDEGQKTKEKIAAAGVSDNVYYELLMAEKIADRTVGNNNNKRSKEEYIAALDMVDMTNAERAALFDAAYKKGNPYR